MGRPALQEDEKRVIQVNTPAESLYRQVPGDEAIAGECCALPRAA